MRASAALSAVLGACALAAVACQSDLDAKKPLPPLDEPFFRCRVQPVIVKSCGSLVCHGSTERFFRVFGRNRFRALLGAGENRSRNTPLTADEQRFNFESASAFVDTSDPSRSFLLMKPLDQKAGGYYHGGATEFGMGDVFLGRDEDDFKTLEEWANGAKEDPACVEPGSG